MYLSGEEEKAKEIFRNLSIARISPKIKNKARGIVNSKENIVKYTGVVIRQESSYAFIKRNMYGDDVFFYNDSLINNWKDFKIGTKVIFNLAFNYKGPICVNVEVQ